MVSEQSRSPNPEPDRFWLSRRQDTKRRFAMTALRQPRPHRRTPIICPDPAARAAPVFRLPSNSLAFGFPARPESCPAKTGRIVKPSVTRSFHAKSRHLLPLKFRQLPMKPETMPVKVRSGELSCSPRKRVSASQPRGQGVKQWHTRTTQPQRKSTASNEPR